MFLRNDIKDDSYITDIVASDYRTAMVFRKYNIDFCCGGKRSLFAVCEDRGLDIDVIRLELHDVMRIYNLSSSINFLHWNTDFLIDYIINVHHEYLTVNFPEIIDTVERFAAGHKTKYPFLPALLTLLYDLRDEMIPHIDQENKIIFPYIKQIVHAYESKEAYAGLLVRTLRKPIENMMQHEHEHLTNYIHRMRELTDNYTPPLHSCITHKVAFLKLRELDSDLVQHIHLENNILFPRAIAMEKELLSGVARERL